MERSGSSLREGAKARPRGRREGAGISGSGFGADSPSGDDAHAGLSVAEGFVLHEAIGLGKQGKVAPEPAVESRMHLRADLAHEDGARPDCLPGIDLDAPPLTGRVRSIAAGALSLLVSHGTDLEGRPPPRGVRRWSL